MVNRRLNSRRGAAQPGAPRRTRLWATVAVTALLLLVAVLLSKYQSAEIVGIAAVVDGDSLVIDGERIRLEGIDAPERDQTCERDGKDWPCGRESERRLKALIGGRIVRCIGSGYDRFDRLLAVCRVGDTDINAAQVRAGWALAYGGYDLEEAEAEADRLGVWQGTFERPRAWRDLHGDVLPLFGGQ